MNEIDYPTHRGAVDARHDRIAHDMRAAGLSPTREVRGLYMVTTATRGGVTLDVLTPLWMDNDGWCGIRLVEDDPRLDQVIMDTAEAIALAARLSARETPPAWGSSRGCERKWT